jgi:hypothetical protein
VRDQLPDAVRVAHHSRLLQLNVEDHVEHLRGERLLEFITGLLPSRDAVCGPQDLDEEQQTWVSPLLGGAHQLADLGLVELRGVVRSNWHSRHMVDQRFEECNVPDESLLAVYMHGQRETDRLQDGGLLRSAARSVLGQLPDGPVTLVATSAGGAGLAATCAALRHQPTTWMQINLLIDTREGTHRVVVVDPVDAGEGWRAAVLGRLPGALFVTPAAPETELGLAA